MRMARLKASNDAPTAFYHCISRVVDRRFILGSAEKERFIRLMRQYEAFCGVRVVTYVVMSNHFHILVEVPRRPDAMPSAAVILSRIEGLHGETHARNVAALLATMREDEARRHLMSYWARMHDVSWFIRMVKQRFTQWYNGRMERVGTLWEQRFKSVLVEGCGRVLAAVAAYIDLNPVRAGLASDPKDYRWCGYGEALSGGVSAREGIRLAVRGLGLGRGGRECEWEVAQAEYRMWLFGQGDESRGHGGIRPERVEAVMREKGRMPVATFLRCRVRYFADGAVIGSRAFVDAVFAEQRWRFGKTRKDGARRMRWVEGLELFSLRNLRKRAVTASPKTEVER